MMDYNSFTKISFQNTLNPKIWHENQDIKPEVLDHLLAITENFISSVPIPEEAITDIVLTGSNANYNWTPTSDLDVHILLNADYFTGTYEHPWITIEDILQTEKTLWNDTHKITIFGIPVELYVTTLQEQVVQNAGVYSLKTQTWLTLPMPVHLSIDNTLVAIKAQAIIVEIRQLITSKSTDIDAVQSLLNKIYTLRSTGLHEGGEFSVENLAFKVIRNSGYLDKIRNYFEQITDQQLSLESVKRMI